MNPTPHKGGNGDAPKGETPPQEPPPPPPPPVMLEEGYDGPIETRSHDVADDK